jgi:demethoxyubiquinone hydroxylase (CLK1/Coq7/Cat5 family)
MTKDHKRPSFLRLFVGGFTLGAAALVGVQVAQAGPDAIIPAAHAITR